MIGGTIRSIFKGGAHDLKKRFSSNDQDDDFPTPLGLRIGAAVDIDTLPLRMHADDLHVSLPETTLMMVAQGYIDLGDSTYVHRYYNADDVMIQVLTASGLEDEHVQELTLYVPFKSYYPDSDGTWAQWIDKGGKLGAPTFTLDDGTTFARIWFNESSGHVEPPQFTEQVYEDPDSNTCTEVFHSTMLFGRNLEDEKKNEYLLVSVEAYDEEKTVELMVGVDIELSTMNVI